jgi:hypothetical protein
MSARSYPVPFQTLAEESSVRLSFLSCPVVLVAAQLVAAWPAAADVTVLGRYTFANGDTATRATYYARKRVRMTSPSGTEFIHDAQDRRVLVIDHAQRRYFSGTIEEADSTASMLLLERRKELKPLIEANQEKWTAMMAAFNDSIEVIQTQETRTIAGYPCTRWILRAGRYMTHERWVARGLSTPNYGPELEKVVMATVLDPLGRQLMKMLIQMREQPGTVLASSTRYQTLTQEGAFSWEAIKVGSETIPKTAWEVPADYVVAKAKVGPK